MDNLQWDANDALVKIHFEGVYQKAIVTVNGHAAGQHAYGYTPFTVDVTPYLHKDNQPVVPKKQYPLPWQRSRLTHFPGHNG